MCMEVKWNCFFLLFTTTFICCYIKCFRCYLFFTLLPLRLYSLPSLHFNYKQKYAQDYFAQVLLVICNASLFIFFFFLFPVNRNKILLNFKRLVLLHCTHTGGIVKEKMRAFSLISISNVYLVSVMCLNFR